MKSPAPWLLVPLLAVALAVRLAGGVYWQSRLDGRFGFGDSGSYWELARTIAEGRPYLYGPGDARVFRTPGYPILLAPIFCLAGGEPSVMWARGLSAVCGTLSVLGVWWLGRELFDERAGLLAAAILAVYPGAVATGALVLTEAPFCPLLLAHLALWIVAWTCLSPARAGVFSFAAGLAAGAATLVRPSWLLFIPFALVTGLATRAAWRRQLAIGAAMIAGLVAVMAPWWIRNARLTGHFVPTTLQVGASLYDGLNPRATGASNMEFVTAFVEAEGGAGAAAGADAGDSLEYRLDRRMRAESLAWARHHPGRVLRLAGIKLWRMWNVWPNEPGLSSWPIRAVVLASYVPVMLLAAIGTCKTIRWGWPYVLCWLPAVYFTALHAVFVSSIRYRQPVMPL